MRTRMGTGFALLAACALLAGCSKGDAMSAAAPAAPEERTSLEAFSAMNEDCLQYLVETRTDGIEVWNADYPWFYLEKADENKFALDKDGKPYAAGVLYHQARAIMDAHPELEKSTRWGVLIMRTVQMSKNGKELSRSEPQKITEFDLDELFRKDAETRKSVSGKS